MIDSSFRVEINSIFFSIAGESPDVVYTDNIAVYEIGADSGQNSIVSKSEITIELKDMTDTTFNVYSTSGGSSIKTFLKVTGINSGLTKTFELKIT